MKQRIRIFDTNTYISYKHKIKPSDVEISALSIVVFYELTATKISSKKTSFVGRLFSSSSN